MCLLYTGERDTLQTATCSSTEWWLGVIFKVEKKKLGFISGALQRAEPGKIAVICSVSIFRRSVSTSKRVWYPDFNLRATQDFHCIKTVNHLRIYYKSHIPCVRRLGQRSSNTHWLSDLNQSSPEMRQQYQRMTTRNRSCFLEHSLGGGSNDQSSVSAVYSTEVNHNDVSLKLLFYQPFGIWYWYFPFYILQTFKLFNKIHSVAK